MGKSSTNLRTIRSERLAQLLRGMFLTQALLPIAWEKALRMSFLFSNTVARGRARGGEPAMVLVLFEALLPSPDP